MSSVPSAARVFGVDATVVSATVPARDHVALELAVGAFPPSEAGHFLQLQCADPDAPGAILHDWDAFAPTDAFGTRSAYLRRPFSIADRFEDEDGRTHLVVISRNIGAGTGWLDSRKFSDTINITGPLGRPFARPAPGVPIALVGGGVGIPPLLYLARQLREAGHEDVTAIFGATGRAYFCVPLIREASADGSPSVCLALPGAAPFPSIVTTDDGTLGLRGRVTDGLRIWAEKRAREIGSAAVFACGPEPMLHAVARQTRQLGIAECQLCIERLMGCGMGTCLSCIVPVPDESAAGGRRWALSCSEGPVFPRDRLLDFADRND